VITHTFAIWISKLQQLNLPFWISFFGIVGDTETFSFKFQK